MSLINHFKWQVPTNEQLVILIFIKSVIPSVSGQEVSLINYLKWKVPTNEQLEPFQKCHPQCVWSRDVTNQTFQVENSTKEQLVIIIFIKSVIPNVSGQEMSSIKHMPSGKSQPTDNLHLPFTLWHVASSNQRTACIYLLPYVKWQVVTNGQLASTFSPIKCMLSGKSQLLEQNAFNKHYP